MQLRRQVGVNRLAVEHAVWRPADDPAVPASEALLRDRHLKINRFGVVRFVWGAFGGFRVLATESGVVGVGVGVGRGKR